VLERVQRGSVPQRNVRVIRRIGKLLGEYPVPARVVDAGGAFAACAPPALVERGLIFFRRDALPSPWTRAAGRSCAQQLTYLSVVAESLKKNLSGQTANDNFR
jgi:hypothetical protein